MKHTPALLTTLLLAPLAALHAADRQPATPTAKPNIILILADDLGYGDPACYGGKLVPTPAIDSLARDGVRCTDGYVTAPVCAPSRCGLMTGAFNQRFGMQWNEDQYRNRSYSVPASHQLLPQALKAAGYVTGHIGKWNIGADITGCFDETHDVIDWEADYFPNNAGHYRGVDNPAEPDSSKVQGVWGPERPGEEYLTDRIGRHAVEFVEKHKAQPFFLYLAFNAVHSPWSAKTSDREKFAHIKDPPLNFYAAMIASLDENIGRVLAKLKDAGLEQNTLVAFVSDNGPALGKPAVKVWPEDWPKEILVGSAGPLNGHKGQFFEGGIRVPFILRWPAQFKSGKTYRQPVSTMDFYATFCAAADAPVPTGTKLDGVNLLPHLREEKAGAPHDILFWKNGEQGAVRQGDWKLVLSQWQPKLQLFNLADDIGEKLDLAEDKPDLVAKLHKSWLDWSATLPARANPPSAKPGNGKTAAAGAKPAQDRGALFETKDKNLDGRLSRDEFLAGQADPEAAKGRFEGWDIDKDGLLSREEFVTMGAKGNGRQAPGLVEFMDIYPTLCDLATLPPPAHLEGVSAVPLLNDPARSWKAAAFTQYPCPALREWAGLPLDQDMSRLFRPLMGRIEKQIQAMDPDDFSLEKYNRHVTGYSMRTDRYRFVHWCDDRQPDKPVAVELYDHQSDPDENENVAGKPEHADTVIALRQQLKVSLSAKSNR